MFSICPKKVYQNNNLNGVDVRVYLAIQGFANEKGFCYPSVSKIADICGVSRRTVFRSLNNLEQNKCIAREKRMRDDGGFSSNGYYLQLEPDDVTNESQGGVTIESLPSDIDVTSNKNQITKNINLKFIKQRARARVNGRTVNEAVPVVDMCDVNDVLSCIEQIKQAKNYSFFKIERGCIGFRPLMRSLHDALTECDITNFFNEKCNREIVFYDFNEHNKNEVNIEF